MNGRYHDDYQRGPPPPNQRPPPGQYSQRPPPQNYPPQQGRRYDQRPPPQRAQYPPQQPVQRRPPPPQQQHSQECQPRNDPRGNGGQNGYDDRNQRHNDTYYEDQYQYDQPQPQDQYHSYDYDYRNDRQYQYDEGYRASAERPLQQDQQGYGVAPFGDVHTHSSSAETQRSSKERARILQDKPESPKSVPWDNPFGAFPTKKPLVKTNDKRSSEDGERVRSSDSYHSSRQANSRPSTAQGNVPRTDTVGHVMPQTTRPQDTNSQPYDYQHNLPQQDAQYQRQEDNRSYGPPQRAMTGPVPQHSNYGYDNNQSYDAPNPGMVRQHTYDGYPNGRPTDSGHHRDSSGSQRGPQPHSLPQVLRQTEGRGMGVSTSQFPGHNDPNVAHTTSSHNSYEMTNSQAQPLSPTRETPNFDAMGANSNEDQLSHPQPEVSKPIQPYRKPTYQNAAPIQKTVVTTQDNQGELVSPLAEFSFDLPSTRNEQSQSQRYEGARQPNSTCPDYIQPTSPVNQEVQSQYPPRSASRGDVRQPRDPYTQQPPIPQGPASPTYASGPGNFNGDSNRGYQQSRPPPTNGYGSYQGPPVRNPPVRTDTSRSGYDDRLQPNRTGTPASMPAYQDMPSRPATSNSLPPHMNGVDRRTSSDNQQSNNRSQIDPNARPVPFRPGLMQQPSTPSPVNQPPPQRPPQGAGPPPSGNKAPITLQELNSLRLSYQNNPGNNELGFQFAKRLVEAAKVLPGQNGSGDPKQMAKNRERYIMDAHRTLKKLIQSGYTEAMFYMADCYGQGSLGLQSDPKEAFQLYQSAAKLGHAQAAYRVAVCCELGPEDGGGTRRDPLKAVQWYKRAASLGDAPAMYKMGMIQLKGLLGQPKSPREAISWLKRAAERADEENPHALHELALLYESAQSTDIVVRDERYALQLFTQAAELGYKYSQFRLGSAYEYGKLGCTIDPRMSIAWYSKAAAQGEHQAEFALSGWYLTGSGPLGPGQPPLLEQSDAEAYLWARKAAASGLAKAEYAMGYYTEVGIGVSPSIEEAKKWYFRAAAQSHPKARERLEDLRRGGARMQKTRVSRSHVGKHNEGECTVM